METYTLRYHPAEATSGVRWLAVGFIAGFVSVLIFHQAVFALFNALGLIHRPIYSMHSTAPWGVPEIWSISFWGGVWGVIFAAFFVPLWDGALILAGIAFGAFVLSAVAWFVVAPMDGQGIAAGAVPMGMAAGMVANGAWGFGTALGLVFFGRSRRRDWDAS